jgi:hypothetical protein
MGSCKSGGGAIAVHLSTCVLARQWFQAKATAIWEELVWDRKREIKQVESRSSLHLDALIASSINVGTRELAIWDAGARVWLEAADKSRSVQQTQLVFIADNLDTPVESTPTTYKTILGCMAQGYGSTRRRCGSRLTDGISAPRLVIPALVS